MNVTERIDAVERRIRLLDAGTVPVNVENGFAQAVQKTNGILPQAFSRETIDRRILESSAAWNVDASLVKAIIQNESGFAVEAVSPAGAQGLMQLMPETAASLGVTAAFDPQQNIAAGTRYLRSLLDRFKGSITLAVAAYNAGPGAVARFGGVPPYRETQKYVASVMASYKKYRAQAANRLEI